MTAPVTEMPQWLSGAPAPPQNGRTSDQTNVEELAQSILAQYHFARDAGGRLYVFEDGVYRPGGERRVKQAVKRRMLGWGIAAKWQSHKANEVLEFIAVDSQELWTDLPVNTINVLNGLLEVADPENPILRPHSPEFLSSIQIPVTYDPEADCEFANQFVAQVFPGDSEAIAWEVPAWLMTSENRIQKALLLLGEGANGKSTYLRWLVNFVGKRNTAALSLHKLEQDRFAGARLVGKLANVCPDLPTAHLSSTSMFKAVTGGDVLSGEFKFKDSFEYTPFCKLVFSANKPPQSDDATHGFFRRWQVVPFTRCFEEGAAGTMNREELDSRLADPKEMSGLLNKALRALSKIRKSGFTQSPTMQAAWDEFRTATDPLSVWVDQQTEALPTAQVLQSELFLAFNRHLTDLGKPAMTKTAFGLAFKRIRPAIEAAQRTHLGRPKQWVYAGIKLRETHDPHQGAGE